MTTIQDRLRDQRWNSLGYYSETAKEAADRIDALVEALRRLDNLTAHDAAIVAAALGEGE